MTQLPGVMLIDMDETILSAYGRPDIAWNNVAREFTGEFAPLSSQQVAAAIVESGRKFWAAAGAEWRLKLRQARHIVVRDGFATPAAAHPTTLSTDPSTPPPDPLTPHPQEGIFL